MKTVRFKANGRLAKLIDTKYAKEISKVLSYAMPGSHFSLAVKEGRWDGMIRMMEDNVVSIGLIRAPEIRKELEAAGFKIKLIKWKNRPKYHPRKGFNGTVKKYLYQNDIVVAMLKAIPLGGGILISATGTGKTKIAAQFASWVASPILFIVDQVDLLYQSAKEIEEWLKYPVGVVGNSKYQPSDRITVATIQTLYKHADDVKFLRWLKTIKIVIIDELHVQMAYSHFSVINCIQPDAVFGLTATLQLKKKPVRMKAYSICGPVIATYTVEEGMQDKVLTKGVAVQVILPNTTKLTTTTLPSWLTIGQRMKIQSSNYNDAVTYNVSANRTIARFVEHCISKDYVVAVLVERIGHLKTLQKMFEDKGLDPRVAYGAVKVKDRQKIRRRMDKGKENLIIANQVFKKGINLKRLDLIVDCSQRSNRNDVLQKFGRGVRLHDDKTGLLHFDFTIDSLMDKPAKERLKAFKSAKIPVLTCKYTTSKEVLKLGEQLLQKSIRGK